MGRARITHPILSQSREWVAGVSSSRPRRKRLGPKVPPQRDPSHPPAKRDPSHPLMRIAHVFLAQGLDVATSLLFEEVRYLACAAAAGKFDDIFAEPAVAKEAPARMSLLAIASCLSLKAAFNGEYPSWGRE